MTIYGYCRVSSYESGKDGLSLKTQRELILSQYPNADIHEEAESGKDIDHRIVLQGLLGTLQRGDILVVKHYDRFARSSIDLLNMVLYFHAEGINLVSLENNIDSTTAEGYMLLTILASVAQFEREIDSRRTKSVLAQRTKEGKKNGGHVPYGFDCVGGLLVQNVEERQQITKMDIWRNQKNFSYCDIAERLNLANVPSKGAGKYRKGKAISGKWSAQAVYKIINRKD